MSNSVSTLPKIFWQFYDLYRRKQLSLQEFSLLSGIPESVLKAYLQTI